MTRQEIIAAIKDQKAELKRLSSARDAVKAKIDELELQFETPFKAGDVVTWDGFVGLGRSRKLRTFTARVRKVSVSEAGELELLYCTSIRKDGTDGASKTVYSWTIRNNETFRKVESEAKAT